MPRPLRIITPGQPLHIVQRGNNRCITFSAAPEFGYYRQLLTKAAAQARCHIHAFVLMTNHVHLLATPADATGPSRLMKTVSETYARYFNHIHKRTGTLWEGRYRATGVDSVEYFFACSRYIELNPLRASLVTRLQDYRWSSFAQNADGAPKDLITAHPLYRDLAPTDHERRAVYRAMFDEALQPSTLDAIRYAIRHRTGPKKATTRMTRVEAVRRSLRGSEATRPLPFPDFGA
jgi:REP-associated tyrosine transposase